MPLPLRLGDEDDANDCGATGTGCVVEVPIPEGGGDINVEVADGVAATAAVAVFNDDSIGVLAGVLPMKE